jgi:hypothetical protein
VKFHVLLTTYEMLSKHLTDIKRLHWATLVVDEAHRLKSAASKLFQVRPCGPGPHGFAAVLWKEGASGHGLYCLPRGVLVA